MSRDTSDSPAPRARLSRERVLHAAVELADEIGIEALSMRRLGQHLGVEAMSLYHHVANKDALLDAMVDLVFSEIQVPSAEDGWQTAMRRRATSVRTVMRRHRWAVGLMESRSSPGPATLRHHDALIGCLRESGFSVHLAAHAVSAVDSYVYGFIQQERALPFEDPQAIPEIAQAFLAQFPASEYPYLAELTIEHVLQPGYDYADEYQFGLGLVLTGLEALIAAAR